MTLNNQDIEGDFIVDNISSLSITMVNSSIKGKINTDNASTDVSITLDAASSITLTGNSYISSLSNADTTGSNINKGSYILADNDGNEYTATGSSTASTDSTKSTSSTSDSNSDTDNSSDNDTDTIFIIRNSSRNNFCSYPIIYSILGFILLFLL